MKLSAIEAVGFKSFADKVELNFIDGITAIVGPNGSGKSNVSDAIRWVLGEQSIRTLRGASMEDVIFSGSGKRRALNIAEVSLFFSNQDGILPVDFQEVSICRRLFRSGDSAYFINKTPCRLKDIHDLFADTGLGKGSLSIIGQNKVDEILNGKPEDRRLIFEEAAGITRYKLRKKDAMKRLEETDDNLTRLNDIQVEVVARLEPLEISAQKTQQFNILDGRLKECRITIAVRKIDKAHQTTKQAKEQIEQLKNEDTDISTKLNINENNLFFLVQQLEEVSVKLSTVQQQIAQAEATIEKLSGQKDVLSERITQNSERSKGIDQDKERLAEQIQQLHKQLEDYAGRLEKQTINEQTAKKDQDTWEQEFAKIEERIAQIEQEQQEEQSNILERKRHILQTNNDIKATDAEIASIARKIDKLNQEKEQTQGRLSKLQSELTDYQEKIKQHDADKVKCVSLLEELEVENNKNKYSLQAINDQERKFADTSASLGTRVNILSKLQAEYDGFSHSVKKLMTSQKPWRQNLLGAVGELLTVPSDLVLAIETALGGAMQNIVAQDDIAAKQAIEFLKQEKAGRATFLPLNNLKYYPPTKDDVQFANASGILGFADKLIKFDKKVQPAMEFLLGRTIVAKDLDSAVKVNRSGNSRLRIVTLDGDVIYAGGTMSGGSRANKESGFLSRAKEIKDSQEKLVDLQKQIEESLQNKRGIEQKIVDNDDRVQQVKNDIAKYNLELATINASCSELEKSEKQYSVGLNTIVFEYEEVLKEKTELTLNLQKLGDSKLVAEQEDQQKVNLSGELSVELQTIKKERDTANSNYHQAKAKYETAKTTTELIQEQYNSVKMQSEGLLENKQRLADEYNSFQNNITTAQKEQESVLQTITQTNDSLKLSKEELDKVAAQQLKLLPEQKVFEKEEKELRSQLNAVQSRLRNAETIFVRNETELNMANEQLSSTYDLTLDEARAFYQKDLPDNVLASEIDRLDKKIAELGPINPVAIEEYAELKERHDFMVSQYDDLVKAKDDLKALINDIDRTMTKQFKEAFDAINAHFEDCFSRLFGGGSAKLKLLEPNNILSTGIDIIVQPPGKKLQTLSLLSGGERALTVIALLFAMLSYRPTPFCVLDEIDAALDEANVERFTKFLVDFAKDTQFVVITHRKYTMESAHLLHGITMEESGVSKLVSIKMIDNVVATN